MFIQLVRVYVTYSLYMLYTRVGGLAYHSGQIITSLFGYLKDFLWQDLENFGVLGIEKKYTACKLRISS
jgi:hypothetical protein